jgi:hypothetical protein
VCPSQERSVKFFGGWTRCWLRHFLLDEQNYLIEAVAVELVTIKCREVEPLNCRQTVTKFPAKREQNRKLQKIKRHAN